MLMRPFDHIVAVYALHVHVSAVHAQQASLVCRIDGESDTGAELQNSSEDQKAQASQLAP